MEIETNMDNEMSYVDRVAQAHGGDDEASDGDDDEDWVEGEPGQDGDADDGEDEGGRMEEDSDQGEDEEDDDRMEEDQDTGGDGDDSAAGETDDVLEYDVDDLRDSAHAVYFDMGEGPDRMIRNPNEVDDARPVQMELSELAKETLTWRLDQSFSDWTIVVSSDDGSIDPVEYNVHRHILATGPKKSGYFEGMLLSLGEFQEQGNSTSPIALPVDIVLAFPLFLDYLYAPISEAKCIITPENVAQLRHLADYFLVPALSNAVHEFIKADMNCVERTEEYLRMAVREGLDELVAHAAYVCIRNLCEIDELSSLLHSMPPAFFWHFIAYASQLGREQFQIEVFAYGSFATTLHGNVASYMRKHGGQLGLPFFFAVFDQIADLMPNESEARTHGLSVREEAFAAVMSYFDLFKQHGWILEYVHVGSDYLQYFPPARFITFCTNALYSYMYIPRSDGEEIDDREIANIMTKVPHSIATALVVKTSKKCRGVGNSTESVGVENE